MSDKAMTNEEVNKFIFTRQEVADILAKYIERHQIQGHVLISGPRLVIGTHDIVLESDVVE